MVRMEVLERKFREAVEKETLVRIEDAARISIARGHLVAAHENLQSMKTEEDILQTAPNPLPHKKWVVTKGYYAMFRAALSLLANKGWTNKRDHEPVPIALQVLYSEEEPSITNEIVKMANALKKARRARQDSSNGLYLSRRKFDTC